MTSPINHVKNDHFINKAIGVLYIENNTDDVYMIKDLLLPYAGRFRLETVDTLRKGIHCLARRPFDFDVLLLPPGLPGFPGLQGLKKIKQKFPDIPVILLTGSDDKAEGTEAIKMGAQDYLVKPGITRKLLFNCIRYSIGRQQLMVQLKKETAELDKSETQLRKIIRNNANGMIVLDMEGRVCFINPTGEKLMGRSAGELTDEFFGFPIVTDDSIEIEIIRKTRRGRLRVAEMWMTDFQWEGKPAYLVSIRDVSAHKDIENALLKEKELLDVTFRSIGEGVVTTDEKGTVILINHVMEKLCRCTQMEASGKPVSQILNIRNKANKDLRENPVEETLKTGRPSHVVKDREWVCPDGKVLLIEYDCSPLSGKNNEIIGSVLTISDVTRKKEMEEELLKARKLESLGVLAAGLAHEYNNELTAVLGNISMAQMTFNKKEQITRRMKRAEEAALRAKELTQRLLTFSRGGEPIKKTGSLSPLLKETAAWARKYTGIRCRCFIPKDLPAVQFDKTQVKRVLYNIAKNAVESMPNGGLITFKTEMVALSKHEAGSLFLKPGNYVKIIIIDQGVGIAAENLGKVYDPYFKHGKDSEGMGLTTAYSIVKKHGGTIQAASTLGVGSTFSVFVPALVPVVPTVPVDRQKPVISQNRLPDPGPGDKKRKILVMDDNPIIRKLAERMLKQLGYQMAATKNGQEALQVYREAKQEKEPFDAVILDLLIADGMGGKECMEKLQKIDRNVKAIVCSGYSDNPVMAEYREYGFSQRIPKPFTIQDLKHALHQVLAKGGK